jgi:Skp family chaperone for outer membrane proteins
MLLRVDLAFLPIRSVSNCLMNATYLPFDTGSSMIFLSQVLAQNSATVRIMLAVTSLLLVGCQNATQSGKPTVAVIDVETVLKDTGRLEVFTKSLNQKQAEIQSNLKLFEQGLLFSLQEKEKKLGKELNDDQKRELMADSQRASMTFKGKQAEMQQHYYDFVNQQRTKYITNEINPLVTAICKERGYFLVLVKTEAILVNEDSIDITALVIERLKAIPITEPSMGETNPEMPGMGAPGGLPSGNFVPPGMTPPGGGVPPIGMPSGALPKIETPKTTTPLPTGKLPSGDLPSSGEKAATEKPADKPAAVTPETKSEPKPETKPEAKPMDTPAAKKETPAESPSGAENPKSSSQPAESASPSVESTPPASGSTSK